jgi:hypothetical protein
MATSIRVALHALFFVGVMKLIDCTALRPVDVCVDFPKLASDSGIDSGNSGGARHD